MGGSEMKKIGSKIVAFRTVKVATQAEQVPAPETAPTLMNETLERPEVLTGKTYKIKPVSIEAAIYLTINNYTLPSGDVRPYEIFINSKDSTALQWMTAMTRLISAVFRKGGDCTFLVEELKSVFDPNGGYFGKGGIYHNSVVAEIGEVIKQHLTDLGMMGNKPPIEMLKEVKASTCPKCHDATLVSMDGCPTCLSCGYSKCG